MTTPSPPRIEKILPLTPLQRFMLGLALREDEGYCDPYVIQTWGRLAGDFDTDSVARVWRLLTQRHAALRSAFVNQGQREPRQVVLEQGHLQFDELDWRQPAEPFERAFAALRQQERQRGFDLVKPPLLRLRLLRTGEREAWFLMTSHHIILDGWSQQIVLAEFQRLLEAELQGARLELPPAIGPEALLQRFQAAPSGQTEAYWRATLAGWAYQPLPRPAQAPARPGAVRPTEQLPAQIVQALERRAREARITPGTLAAAAWALCLARLHGSRRVTLGLTTSGRDGSETGQQAVGMFVNTLPLVIDCNPAWPLAQFVQQAAVALRALTEHDHVDLSQLQRLAGAGPDRPLFDSLVAFENFPGAPPAASRVQVSDLQSDERTSLAAALVVVPGAAAWRLALQADTQLLDAGLARRLLAMSAEALRALARNDAPTVGALLDRLHWAGDAPAQARWLDAPATDSLLTRFLQRAQAQPGRPAVRFAHQPPLSYADLAQASRRVAAGLAARGVRPGDRVSLCAERGGDLLILMLGILRAGASYVPIDPHQPAQRQNAILADSRPALRISDQLQGGADGAQGAATPAELLRHPDDAWQDLPACAGACAYIIYTSGSTGRPKGVMVSHANVLGLMVGSESLFDFGPDDVWSFFHSFAFDFSVWEIWGAWLTGGSALVVPHATSRDPEAFVALCEREGVSVLSQTPSAFTAFEYAQSQSPHTLAALRTIVFGGEALGTGALQRWRRRFPAGQPRLINMYGITETTVHVTFHEVSETDLENAALVPLGRALPHLDLALLDDSARPVPAQAVGEIVVGGAGISTGYFDAPRLTAERFVPDPDATRPGQRRYRSGDLAQRDAGGALRPLGRADRQVKVRGFRIELGEIEHALLRIPGIVNAVAGTWNKGQGRNQGDAAQPGLCAWIVPEAGRDAPAEAWLRERLADLLPAYMLPERFVALTAIPLTANGKTDLARLSLPDAGSPPAAAAPHDALTASIRQVWAEALQLEQVGPDDNYFSLGGDSIRSLRVISLARARGLQLPIARLYQNPTPRSLAAWLQADASAANTPAPAGEAPLAAFHGIGAAERAALPAQAVDAWPATRLQMGMLFNAGFGEQSKRYLDIFCMEVQLEGTPESLEQSVLALIERHPVLRSCFIQAEDRMLQVVLPRNLGPLRVTDLRGLPSHFQQEALQAEFEALEKATLRPERPELFQLHVSRLADARWSMLFLLHHAILDGWSLSLLYAELFDAWARTVSGTVDATPAPAWQAWLAREERRAQDDPALRQRWQARLDALPGGALWPWPQPPAQAAGTVQPSPSRIPLPLPAGLLARLNERARASGLPLKSWLLAGSAHVLGWAMGQAEVAIGLVTSCRPASEQGESAIGMFLGTLPAHCASRGRWSALAQRAHQAESQWLDDRFMPLAELARMHGRQPFQATFNFVNFRATGAISRHVTYDPARSRELTEIEIAITFSLSPNGEQLHGEVALAPRYPRSQAQWLADRLTEALRQMADSPEAPARLYDPLSPAALLPAPPDEAEPPYRAALRRLRGHPDAIAALTADGVPMSGAELLEILLGQVRALQTLGDLRGRPVALALPRSVQLATAQIAVQALGGWTLVLDLEAPATRSQAILDDLPGCAMAFDSAVADPGALQCPRRLDFADAPAAGLDDEAALLEALLKDSDSPGSAPRPALATAYGIYTSGSTGRPKGVLVSQRALAAHMRWMNAEFGFGPKDRVLFRTRPSFDASVWEIWAPLMTGAQLVIAPPEAGRDPSAIALTLTLRRITVLQVVPSLLEMMTEGQEAQALQGLRLLFAGGEPLKPDTVRRFGPQPGFTLVNLYGPSETTVDATFERVLPQAAQGDCLEGLASAPIGRPVAASHAWVVDSQLELLPVGAPGELLLGGACVGLGYRDEPRQSAERYVPDPYGSAGERAFRTRDLVRRLPDGRLVFLSRLDNQVKLGGNRVELEEIEAALAPLTAPARVAASIQGIDGLDRLVAFVEQRGSISAGALRQTLLERLPAYMTPSVYRRVRTWPALPSGKTDRARLWDASEPWDASHDAAPAAPASETPPVPAAESRAEQSLVRFLSRLLDRPVQADDDFFTLGGDSILAMQLVAKARQAGLNLRPQDVFRHRSVRQMARHLPAGPDLAALPEPPASAWPALPAQAWFLRHDWANPDQWNQIVGLALPPGVQGSALRHALQTLARRHRALGTRVNAARHLHEADALPALCEIAHGGGEQADLAALRRAVAELQAALSLPRGPVWGAVLACDDSGQARWCALAVHHLVVDGYSWRVLFEELQTLLENQPLPAPPPSGPALAGALRALPAHAPSMAHWQAYAQAVAALPSRPSWGPQGQSRDVLRVLGPAETAALLARAESHWRVKPEALLSAALLWTLARLQHPQALTLAVERHGRDLPGIAAAERSVGWFTRLYPWLAQPDADLYAALRQVKASQRPWAALQTDWLGATQADAGLQALPDAEAVINFLGSFDASFAASGLLRPLEHELGPGIDPRNRRLSGLEVVALVSNGQLRLSLSCDAPHWGAQAQALLDGVTEGLREFGRETGQGHAWLGSDFPWLQTSDAEIDALWARHPGLADILPATPAQEGMVFTQQRDGTGNGVYVQQLEIHARGPLPPDEVRARFHRLAQRHAALRTSFEVSESGQVLQLVHERADMPVETVTLPADADPAQAWRDFARADAERGFDLGQAPLSRASVWTGPAGCRVLWSHHHLILDGWSLPIVLHELGLELTALQSLPAPVPQQPFWDWLIEERAPARQASRQTEWQRRFAGFAATPRVADACRAPLTPHAGGRHSSVLDAAALQSLRAFAAGRRLTLSTLVAGAWGLVLSRLLRCHDLAIGMVVSGRPAALAASGQWVGMFINTLPLRLRIERQTPLADWLADVQAQVLELSQHSQDSLAEVRAWTGVAQLFESIVVYQNYPLTPADTDAAGQMPIDRVLAEERNEYPLSLYAHPHAPTHEHPREGLELTLRFDPRLISGQLADALLSGVARALHAWAEGQAATVAATDILGPQRHARAQANLSRDAAPNLDWVAAGIVAQARRRPQAAALLDAQGRTFSYAELAGAASRLARRLQDAGAGPETVVAVAGGGDTATVLALLAVHFSGAAFLPLDPALPRQRLATMLEQARPLLVLGPQEAARQVAGGAWPVHALDETSLARLFESAADEPAQLPRPPAPLGLAYLIYTSGSTGQPKGVQIGHAAFANALGSMIARPGLDIADRFASVTTISFDISLLEIFGTLLAGATLCPVDGDTARDGRALAHRLEAQAITVMQATPATWKLLREEGFNRPALRVWCGGEALDASLADWLRGAFGEIWNMYGPTETTIWSSVYRLESPQICVGRPIARTGLHVLDAEGDLALPGAYGELAISGASVSRGYLQRPGQTAGSFVPSLLGDGSVMYRTGDLACQLEDGSHLVLGRLDRQLKVDGFRIEPGDIESAIRAALGLREAVVGMATGPDASQGLTAWLVLPSTESLDAAAAQAALAERLPRYMVPRHWVSLPALPLTPNGKIDMKALPPPVAELRSAQPAPAAQTGHPGLALLVAALCRLLLKQPDFGVEDDFFARGGHSLLAMQLRARIEKVAQADIPLRLLFDARTPLDVARRLHALPGIAADIDARALALLHKQPRSSPSSP